jgi:hypothetical protein
MQSSLILVSLGSAFALNIVANGPSLKKAPATGASTVKMPVDHLAEIFKKLDANADGFLDEDELGVAFKSLGKDVDEATVHHSFTLLDKDHDGMVDLTEFKAIAEQNVVSSLADMLMRDNMSVFEDNEDNPFANAQFARDRKLAASDPAKWCADRCLATGHCEVVEDFAKMSTAEVMSFCNSCVGEEECTL